VKAGERTVMGHDILLERFQDGKENKTVVDFQLEGRITTGAQEHYYLEPHSALAVPSGEKRELTIHFTTQEPSPVQATIAAVLGLHQNKIIVKCKRTGGAFGGKERCQVAIIAALAADKLGRPCRFVLPREVDVDITGHRHSVSAAYTVGVDGKTGRIERAAVECNYNAGFSWDLSESWGLILSMRIDGGYTLRNVSARQVCGSAGSETRFVFFGRIQNFPHLDPAPIRNSNPFLSQAKEKTIWFYNITIP
jgi:xanthine dehydrogenase molybdopterin-binding subunit B